MRQIMTMSACALVLAATGGAAQAGFVNGDIVFTDAPDDAIRVVRSGTNAVDTLYTFSDPNDQIRLAEITRVNGRFYVNSGFAQADLGIPGRLIEIQGLFGSAPTEGTLASGGFLQNPIGLEFNRRSDQFLAINNTGQTQMQAAPDFDGIIGIDRQTGNQTFRFDEEVGDPMRPRYQAGARIARDASDANRYFVSTVNGGTLQDTNLPPGDFDKASALYSVSVDSSGATSVDLFADFSSTDFGPLTFVRGVTTAVGADNLLDIYITDGFTNGIYHVDLDANGDVASIDQLIGGLANPGNIIYDRFTDTLVFGEVDGDSISRINLDGTGLEVLATGVDPRGFYIVPAPGAMALFGLGGLVAARRRR